MRIMVFFDLPTVSSEDLREYRIFRKELIKLGFMMLQESVYVRLALNATVEKAMIDKLRKIKPEKGLVQVLSITEKQYNNMETLVGEVKSETLDTDDRMVIL
ncbi:MAG: CRISPR-associated endonuclease Cas2 [Tissierellia bacterium]|nr:CRISPR-associated endonuclease Cas2 [Tissierellia bacterium]